LKNFKNKHIMLKLSGEALMGDKEFGIDLSTINSITEQIAYVFKKGLKISIVVGGGIFLEVYPHHQQAWIDHPLTILE
jgi:uridylate kinase